MSTESEEYNEHLEKAKEQFQKTKEAAKIVQENLTRFSGTPPYRMPNTIAPDDSRIVPMYSEIINILLRQLDLGDEDIGEDEASFTVTAEFESNPITEKRYNFMIKLEKSLFSVRTTTENQLWLLTNIANPGPSDSMMGTTTDGEQVNIATELARFKNTYFVDLKTSLEEFIASEDVLYVLNNHDPTIRILPFLPDEDIDIIGHLMKSPRGWKDKDLCSPFIDLSNKEYCITVEVPITQVSTGESEAELEEETSETSSPAAAAMAAGQEDSPSPGEFVETDKEANYVLVSNGNKNLAKLIGAKELMKFLDRQKILPDTLVEILEASDGAFARIKNNEVHSDSDRDDGLKKYLVRFPIKYFDHPRLTGTRSSKATTGDLVSTGLIKHQFSFSLENIDNIIQNLTEKVLRGKIKPAIDSFTGDKSTFPNIDNQIQTINKFVSKIKEYLRDNDSGENNDPAQTLYEIGADYDFKPVYVVKYAQEGVEPAKPKFLNIGLNCLAEKEPFSENTAMAYIFWSCQAIEDPEEDGLKLLEKYTYPVPRIEPGSENKGPRTTSQASEAETDKTHPEEQRKRPKKTAQQLAEEDKQAKLPETWEELYKKLEESAANDPKKSPGTFFSFTGIPGLETYSKDPNSVYTEILYRIDLIDIFRKIAACLAKVIGIELSAEAICRSILDQLGVERVVEFVQEFGTPSVLYEGATEWLNEIASEEAKYALGNIDLGSPHDAIISSVDIILTSEGKKDTAAGQFFSSLKQSELSDDPSAVEMAAAGTQAAIAAAEAVPPTTINVTVGKDSAGNDIFLFDNEKNPIITLRKGRTYIFDQTEKSNTRPQGTFDNHNVLGFSTAMDGIHTNGDIYDNQVTWLISDEERTFSSYSSTFATESEEGGVIPLDALIKKQIKFIVPDNDSIPDTLYYFSHQNPNLGQKLLIVSSVVVSGEDEEIYSQSIGLAGSATAEAITTGQVSDPRSSRENRENFLRSGQQRDPSTVDRNDYNFDVDHVTGHGMREAAKLPSNVLSNPTLNNATGGAPRKFTQDVDGMTNRFEQTATNAADRFAREYTKYIDPQWLCEELGKWVSPGGIATLMNLAANGNLERALLPEVPKFDLIEDLFTEDYFKGVDDILKSMVEEMIVQAIVTLVKDAVDELLSLCRDSFRPPSESEDDADDTPLFGDWDGPLGWPDDSAPTNTTPHSEMAYDATAGVGSGFNRDPSYPVDMGIDNDTRRRFGDMGIPSDFMDVLSDMLDILSKILTPDEICGLLNDNVSDRVLELVKRTIDGIFPQLQPYLSSQSDIKKFFAILGDHLDLSFCLPVTSFIQAAVDDCKDYDPDVVCELLRAKGMSEEELQTVCNNQTNEARDRLSEILSLLNDPDFPANILINPGIESVVCQPGFTGQRTAAIPQLQNLFNRSLHSIVNFIKDSLHRDLRNYKQSLIRTEEKEDTSFRTMPAPYRDYDPDPELPDDPGGPDSETASKLPGFNAFKNKSSWPYPKIQQRTVAPEFRAALLDPTTLRSNHGYMEVLEGGGTRFVRTTAEELSPSQYGIGRSSYKYTSQIMKKAVAEELSGINQLNAQHFQTLKNLGMPQEKIDLLSQLGVMVADSTKIQTSEVVNYEVPRKKFATSDYGYDPEVPNYLNHKLKMMVSYIGKNPRVLTPFGLPVAKKKQVVSKPKSEEYDSLDSNSWQAYLEASGLLDGVVSDEYTIPSQIWARYLTSKIEQFKSDGALPDDMQEKWQDTTNNTDINIFVNQQSAYQGFENAVRASYHEMFLRRSHKVLKEISKSSLFDLRTFENLTLVPTKTFVNNPTSKDKCWTQEKADTRASGLLGTKDLKDKAKEIFNDIACELMTRPSGQIDPMSEAMLYSAVLSYFRLVHIEIVTRGLFMFNRYNISDIVVDSNYIKLYSEIFNFGLEQFSPTILNNFYKLAHFYVSQRVKNGEILRYTDMTGNEKILEYNQFDSADAALFLIKEQGLALDGAIEEFIKDPDAEEVNFFDAMLDHPDLIDVPAKLDNQEVFEMWANANDRVHALDSGPSFAQDSTVQDLMFKEMLRAASGETKDAWTGEEKPQSRRRFDKFYSQPGLKNVIWDDMTQIDPSSFSICRPHELTIGPPYRKYWTKSHLTDLGHNMRNGGFMLQRYIRLGDNHRKDLLAWYDSSDKIDGPQKDVCAFDAFERAIATRFDENSYLKFAENTNFEFGDILSHVDPVHLEEYSSAATAELRSETIEDYKASRLSTFFPQGIKFGIRLVYVLPHLDAIDMHDNQDGLITNSDGTESPLFVNKDLINSFEYIMQKYTSASEERLKGHSPEYKEAAYRLRSYFVCEQSTADKITPHDYFGFGSIPIYTIPLINKETTWTGLQDYDYTLDSLAWSIKEANFLNDIEDDPEHAGRRYRGVSVNSAPDLIPGYTPPSEDFQGVMAFSFPTVRRYGRFMENIFESKYKNQLLQELKEDPEFKMLSEYLFASKKCLSNATLYSCLFPPVSKTTNMDNMFLETRKTIFNIIESLMFDDVNPGDNPAAVYDPPEIDFVDDFSKPSVHTNVSTSVEANPSVATAVVNTPYLIFKMFCEIYDPIVGKAKMIKDSVIMAADLSMSFADDVAEDVMEGQSGPAAELAEMALDAEISSQVTDIAKLVSEMEIKEIILTLTPGPIFPYPLTTLHGWLGPFGIVYMALAWLDPWDLEKAKIQTAQDIAIDGIAESGATSESDLLEGETQCE